MSPHIWVSFFCTLCSYGAATSLDTRNTPNPRDRRELGGARRRNRERYAWVNVTDSFWMKETRLQINAFFVYKASNVVVFQIQNRNKKIDKYRQELMSTWYKRQTAICTGLMSQCDFFFLCKTLHSLGMMTVSYKRGCLLLHTRASLVNNIAELHSYRSCITKSYMIILWIYFVFANTTKGLQFIVWVTICGQSVYCASTSYIVFLLVQNQSGTGSMQSQCNQYTMSNNYITKVHWMRNKEG